MRAPVGVYPGRGPADAPAPPPAAVAPPPPAPSVTGSPPSDAVTLRVLGALGSDPRRIAEPAAAVAPAPTGRAAGVPDPAPAPFPDPRRAAAPRVSAWFTAASPPPGGWRWTVTRKI